MYNNTTKYKYLPITFLRYNILLKLITKQLISQKWFASIYRASSIWQNGPNYIINPVNNFLSIIYFTRNHINQLLNKFTNFNFWKIVTFEFQMYNKLRLIHTYIYVFSCWYKLMKSLIFIWNYWRTFFTSLMLQQKF